MTIMSIIVFKEMGKGLGYNGQILINLVNTETELALECTFCILTVRGVTYTSYLRNVTCISY